MTDREGFLEQKPKVGVIGCGFVGSAVAAGFALKADMKVYDIDPSKSPDSFTGTCKQDILFLCVPTPMRKSDGRPELSYIRSALANIFNTVNLIGYDRKKIIVIKSTVLPGTNRTLQEEYPMFHFISNPEFLTARSARLDFINAARIVVGGEDFDAREDVIRLYKLVFPHTPVYACSWEAAEMVKYMANCFFALKVSYLNEIYQICQKLGLDYNFQKCMWLSDGRIGNSHHEVPGHDGDFGFGGTCFPKDLAAFTSWAREIGNPINTLEAAELVNNEVRVKKDWEVFDDTK